MTIIIGEHFGVTMPYGNILGYTGEHRLRKLLVVHPIFKDAVYTLKFRYSDGVIYEKEITGGKMEVDGSLLREEGEIECQFFAYSDSGDGSASLVFESSPFTLKIGACIDGEVTAIPTYEQAKDMLDKLLAQFKNLSQRQGNITLSVQGEISTPCTVTKLDDTDYVIS